MSEAPDPSTVTDLADLITMLGELRAWAGNPSYRLLAKRVGRLMRPAQEVSVSTVVDVFKTSRRRLNADLLIAVVRALELNESDVARWRDAYLRTQRAAKADSGPTGVLRQLPADLATFTGREQELAILLDAVRDSQIATQTVVVSAIEGMAGVGKTQLAVHAAHELTRAGRYSDVQLYVNLRGFDPERSPAEPAEVLGTFLRQLAVPAREIPDALEERSAMFRDRLHGRQALVLLDNAANEEQVRDLIPAGHGCLVLITSRRRLAGLHGAWLVVLDVFSADEAANLFGAIAGPDRVAAEPEAAAEILEVCGGLPLAVAITAARLRSRPAWRLADLARELRSGQTDAFGRGTRSPWPVFDVSYAGLHPAARRVFRLLAAHLGRDLSAESAAALAGIDVGEAWSILEQLTDEYLVQQKSPGRYELHDLLRVFARRKLADDEPEAERDAALHRLLCWYLVTADAAARALNPAAQWQALPAEAVTHGPPPSETAVFETAAEATAWIGGELTNLIAAVEVAHQAGHHLLCSPIAESLTQYLRLEARKSDIVRTHLFAVASARAAGVSSRESSSLTALGLAETDIGRFEDAEAHLTAAVDICRRSGDPAGQANAMACLAVTLAATGRPEEGVAVAEEALAISRDLGDEGLATRILNNLAICLHCLGRSKDALECMLEALPMFRSMGSSHFYLSVAVRNLGFTYLVLDRFADAEASFTEAAALFRDIGDSYRHVECLHGLARSQFGQGRVSEARETVDRADALLETFDEAWGARYRRQLESSPLRYSETAAVDPTALG